MKMYIGQLPPWIAIVFTIIFSIEVVDRCQNMAANNSDIALSFDSQSQFITTSENRTYLGAHLSSMLASRVRP